MNMPPKLKTAKLANKGIITKKRIPRAAPAHMEMEWTSGDKDAVSVKTLLTNVSTMLAALTARVDWLDTAKR